MVIISGRLYFRDIGLIVNWCVRFDRFNRGVVAVVNDDGQAYIGWRLLADDPAVLTDSLVWLAEGLASRAVPPGVVALGVEILVDVVPDAVVNRMVEDALDALGHDDFILDGFPRTVEQARWLLGHLDEVGAPLDAVLSLRVEPEMIVQRLSRRRTDRETGEIYHLDFNPPPDDLPEGRLLHRSDDQPEAIRTRLQVYEDETQPLAAIFRENAPFFEIDGVGEIDEVQERILEALSEADTRGV